MKVLGNYMKRFSFIAIIVFTGSLLLSCQEQAEPVPILTQAQWQRIQEHVLDEAPAEIDFPVGAIFGERVELVGYDLDPGPRAEVGEELTITWYWRCIAPMEDRWEIFVHLDGANGHRQNLDHEAVNGMYLALNWEPGQVVRDMQTITLDHGFGDTTATFFLGFWRRSDGQRLPISNPGPAELIPDEAGGRLRVGSFETYRDVLTVEASYADTAPTIDGRLNERSWRRAPRTDNWLHPNSGEAVEGLTSHARVMWDTEALYVGLSARDTDIWSTITERDGDLWNEEVLEVYLDPQGDGANYIEVQVNPLGTVFDAIFPAPTNRDLPAARALNVEGMEVGHYVNGTLDDRDRRDNRWTAELRIPWSGLPDFEGPPADGTVISANFYRYDRPADGRVLTAAWSPVHGGSFHQPDKFGRIRLTGAPAPTEPDDSSEGTGSSVRGMQLQRQRPALEVVNPIIRTQPETPTGNE